MKAAVPASGARCFSRRPSGDHGVGSAWICSAARARQRRLAVGLQRVDPQVERRRSVERRHLVFETPAIDRGEVRFEPVRQVAGDRARHLRMRQAAAGEAAGQALLGSPTAAPGGSGRRQSSPRCRRASICRSAAARRSRGVARAPARPRPSRRARSTNRCTARCAQHGIDMRRRPAPGPWRRYSGDGGNNRRRCRRPAARPARSRRGCRSRRRCAAPGVTPRPAAQRESPGISIVSWRRQGPTSAAQDRASAAKAAELASRKVRARWVPACAGTTEKRRLARVTYPAGSSAPRG